MTSRYKIVALFGEAGSGKDYIQKEMMKTDFGKKNLSEIISYTTRPPREGEIDGVHYHFLSRAEELIKQDTLEFTIFKNWWYGTPISSLNKDKINIGVFNISGINQLINQDYLHRVECLPIYIKTISKIRLLRQLQRENNPNCNEIARRFLADQKNFLNIPFGYKIIENNTNEIQPLLNELIDLIIKWNNK